MPRRCFVAAPSPDPLVASAGDAYSQSGSWVVTRIRHMAPWAAAMLALAGVAAALLLTGGSGPPFVTAGGLQLRGGTVAPVKPSRSAVGWGGTGAAAEGGAPG